MLFPQKINVIANTRHLNPQGEVVVTQNDTGVEFLVSVVGDGGQTKLPQDTAYVLTSLHLRKQPSQKIGTLQADGNISFKLGAHELDQTGSVEAYVQAYHPLNGRVTSNPFTYHVASDPLSGAAIMPADKSLIQTVLDEGPVVIQQAKEETQANITERARLTGAVGGALGSLEQDKTEALSTLEAAKAAAVEVTEVAAEKAGLAEEKAVFANAQGTFAKTEGEKATVAAKLATDEAAAARLQKEEIAQTIAKGPVLSVNGQTGPVTGIATTEITNQLSTQLTETSREIFDGNWSTSFAKLPNGGDLHFPKGIYTFSEKINVPNNITLTSNGDAFVNAPIRCHYAENIYINNLFIKDRNDHIHNKKAIDKFKSHIHKSETEIVNVAILGDSIVHGQSSTDYNHLSWAGLLREFLTGFFGNAGFGYQFSGGGNTLYKEGTNCKTYKLTSASSNAALGDFQFKDLQVIKGKNTDGGVFYVHVDGVAYPVDSKGDSREYGIRETVFSEAKVKSRSLALYKPSVAGVTGYYEGLNLINDTKGVMIHQMGHIGLRANEHTDKSIQASITAIAPKLTIIALGYNDFIQQTSVNEYKTAIDKMVVEAQKNNGVVVLLMYQESNDGGSALTYGGHYKQKMMEIAAARNCVLVDIDKKWINQATRISNGYVVQPDQVHPVNVGHKDIFESLKSLFLDMINPNKLFKPSYLTLGAEKTYYFNETQAAIQSQIDNIYKAFDYSDYALLKDDFNPSTGGLSNALSRGDFGDNTGNVFTFSITPEGDQKVTTLRNSSGGTRISWKNTLVIGDEYFVIIKYNTNLTPSTLHNLPGSFVGTGVDTKNSFVRIKGVCLNAANDLRIGFNNDIGTTADYIINYMSIFNLTDISERYGIDFASKTYDEIQNILIGSI